MNRNNFNLSKNFIPPFADQQEVRLIDRVYPIPLVDFGAADITLDFSVKAYID